MNEQATQAAYLLHSRPFKEYQLILDLLTEHDGKVSAVISSGNTLKSNKKAILQPFSPLNISFKPSNHALKKVSFVEPAAPSYQFKGNYLYSGFYLNEMLVRLLGELVPCPALFEHYQTSLLALNAQDDIERTLRHFEFALLEELGLTLDFATIEAQTASHFHFVSEHGFVPALNNNSQVCYSKQHLLAIAAQQLDEPKVLYTCKILMRQIMAPLLGNKPLNSRKLFSQHKLK